MLPRAERTKLGCLLLEVTVHPRQHMIEQRDGLSEMWPLVEHDAFGAR